jgi:hypothetical protein
MNRRDRAQQDFGDEIRRRREEAIGNAKAPGASPQAHNPVEDRCRALRRWKAGWLVWYADGDLRAQRADDYQRLYASLSNFPALDGLVEGYWSRYRGKPGPELWVDAAHYNAGTHIERRNAGLG